ncbi:MAG: hypothetical protein KDD58_00730 [Bdellovibrionales bacterium]|nr:hypothetical protein [Bdellovibrionales bacterium]
MVKKIIKFLTFLFIFIGEFTSVHAFNYKEIDVSKNPPRSELHVFRLSLAELGYHALDNFNSGNIPYLGIDQVYVDSTNNKAIFLKIGWATDSLDIINQIVEMNNGYAFHGMIQENWPFVLFFYKISKNEVNQAIQLLSQNYLISKSAKYSIRNLVLPKVWADESCITTGQPSYNKDLKDVHQRIESQSMMDTISSCLVTAINALKNKTERLFKNTSSFFKKLLSDPRKLWKEVVDRFENIKKAASTIHDSLANLANNLKEIPFEISQQMICSMTGALTPHLLKGITALGAASLATAITSTVKNIETFSEVLKRTIKSSKLSKDEQINFSNRIGLCAVP